MATDSKPRTLTCVLEPHELLKAAAIFAEAEFPNMASGGVTLNSDGSASVELFSHPAPEPVKRTRKAKGAN